MRTDDPDFDLRKRTKRFGVWIIKLSSSLVGDLEAQIMRKQLVRCGTSVGAQYREACRARSGAEFRSKLQSALQELDETSYWMELLAESGRAPRQNMTDLMKEADELMAIFVASIKTSRDGK
ncbi:MAG: four helix bundle protein [Tepidisphaeraceae bacterium]